jgi:glycosyltransferase domain-containing protein
MTQIDGVAQPITHPLTAIVLTRNRPNNVVRQLRVFEKTNFRHPVIVADSSEIEEAARIRDAVPSHIQYVQYPPETSFYEKLASATTRIETPFVALIPDRKITFPHAIDAALAHLINNEDHVAAQGYVVNFNAHANEVDVNKVLFFTSSICEEDPLERHYHLMRRYQPWLFGIFRTKAVLAAAAQAKSVPGAMFQEIMFANTMVLQGKFGRIRQILTFQSPEHSFNPLARTHPFYWFLDDPRSFFRHYAYYTKSLAHFISEHGIAAATEPKLGKLLDTIHTLWLHSNFDYGVLSYACQLQLGYPLAPIPDPRSPSSRRAVRWADKIHKHRKRRYIWRNEVLNAEPKDEIQITHDEIERVERQLDFYFDY